MKLGSKKLNRPGFQRGFCSTLTLHFQACFLLAEPVLHFVRCLVSDHNVQFSLVVPARPFQGFPFEVSGRSPRVEVFDDLRLEQFNKGFGQGVVLAAAEATDRHVDSSSGEPFEVSDGQMPHASVRVLGLPADHRTLLA